jgi:ParB family chromosome partitioning protein
MNSKKRGLGRGLDVLLGSLPKTETNEKTSTATDASSVPIDLIQRGRYQQRRNFDQEKLAELAESISAQGVIQPVLLRSIGAGRYELIAGERRWRAAQLAGLSAVPAVVRDVDDQAAMAMGLIENIQRDDLNPIEEAGAFLRLQDEFNLTHQQIAEAVGKSRATVSNLLRLLDLSPEVKQLTEQGELEMGHARALLPLQADKQRAAARAVIKKGLSVRATEALVKSMLGETPGKVKRPKVATDPNILALSRELEEILGAKVRFQHSKKGSGKLEISYNNMDELEGILAHIQRSKG